MEEILASIRRIISEDDPPADGAEAAPVAEAAPAPVADEPAPEPMAYDEAGDEDEDVLELIDRVDPAPSEPFESVGDLDVFPAAAPAPAPVVSEPAYPKPQGAAFSSEPTTDEALVSPPAASSAASAFASLSQSIAMPRDGRTLEDVVRELLRPLLKDWLDQNLPRIVETAVQAEVERIARRGG